MSKARRRNAAASAAPEPAAVQTVVAHGARWPVLAVFFGGLWLILNNAGGSDLAKAPPYLFVSVWWILAALVAGRLQRRSGGQLWATLAAGLRKPALAISIILLINCMAAVTYAEAGQLGLVSWLAWAGFAGLLLAGVCLAVWMEQDVGSLPAVVLRLLLVLGALVAIHGLLEYFQSGAAQPLGGVFAWHNPAGGYFVLLLPLALARALGDRGSGGWWGAGVALLLGVALLATSSRGAWLTGLIGCGWLVAMLCWQRRAIPVRIAVLVGSVIIALALPFLVGGPLSPVRDRLISLTARQDFSVLGRGHFYSTAFRLFNEGPRGEGMTVLGTGMGTYRWLAPRKQADPRFYASDPHSTFFLWLAELGIAGLLGYCLLWGWWGWIQWGTPHLGLSRGAVAEELWPGMRLDLAGVLAGLLGGWLHWTIDFDSTFQLITWTALLMVAVLVTVLRARGNAGPLLTPQAVQPPPEAQTATGVRLKEWQISRSLSSLLVGLLWCGAVTSLVFGIGRIWYDQGEDKFRAWERSQDAAFLAEAERSYAVAAMIWPWDGDAFRGLSVAELWLGTIAARTDPEIGLETLLKGRDHAQVAVKNATYNAANWFNLAQFDAALLQLGALSQEEAATRLQTSLITAIERDPTNNPRYYVQLTQALALGQPSPNRDQAIIRNMSQFMRYYPPQDITEYSKTRLDWQHLPLSYAQVWPFYLMALKGAELEAQLQEARRIGREQVLPALVECEYTPLEVKQAVAPVVRRIIDEIHTAEGGAVFSPELLRALQGASEDAASGRTTR